jgi:sphingomyelin phosphodiesterase 2
MTVMSLNTRGVPIVGTHLARRYAVIGAELDAGDADVACFQEVFTWWHLRLLARRMRSFGHVSYRPAPPGPAGGLVTFSRRRVSGTMYRGFGVPPRADRISRLTRFRAGMKGALVTRLARPGICVVNTHPVANRDGDWSRAGRFYPLHRAQFDVLTRVVLDVAGPVVVTSTSTAAVPCSANSWQARGWPMHSRAAARRRSVLSTFRQGRRRIASISS